MEDLVEQSRRFLNEQPDEQEYELLNEFISLRTGAIAVGLGKVKQYANKTDQEVRNLKNYANKLIVNYFDLRSGVSSFGATFFSTTTGLITGFSVGVTPIFVSP